MNNDKQKNSEFTFEIKKEILVLNESENENGWDKVLTLISWNNKPPVYDLRFWKKDRSKMGKGISLTKDELTLLLTISGKI